MNMSKTRSSGVSSTAPISWRITPFLALEFVAVEGAVGQDVGKDVDRQSGIGGQDVGVIGRLFDTGRRIEIAAGRFDLLGDRAGGAPPRSLEGHVFEQMRQALLVTGFVPGACRDPDAERRGLDMGHRVRHDAQPGRQSGDFDAHEAIVTVRVAPGLTRSRMNRSTAATSLARTVKRSGRVKRSAM